jgi:hypothetical protein
MERAEHLSLGTEELAFFRLTCDLFPTAESPLRFLADEEAEPEDPAAVFARLQDRGLLNARGSGAAEHVLDRVTPVAECNARVSLSIQGQSQQSRDFYLCAGSAVEYRRDDGAHDFGPVRSEAALTAELAQHFRIAAEGKPRHLRLSAGDYLVFAVFARDVRQAPTPPQAGEAPMSLDEVLAYFDEPETKVLRTPSDDTWRSSVESLTQQGVLVAAAGGYELHPTWHPLAREVVADRQHTVTRFDFLDEQWLVREVSIYPTADSAYRLGTEPDGAVVIQELSSSTLADVLGGVIATLPNLLNPEAMTTLKTPQLQAQARRRR